MRLKGKVAIVTGAGGGLGSAIVRAYYEEGVRGVVAVDASNAGLQTLVSAAYPGFHSILGDVSDPECMRRAVETATREFGSLDVLVNNAGVLSSNARLHNVSVEEWSRVLSINVIGVANGIAAAVPVMRGRGSGSIISTASVSAMTAWSHAGPYGASKAAVVALSRTAAIEYASDGIRSNCVCPGSFASAMFSGVPESAVAAIAAKHPLGLGNTTDLVGAYVYLASDDARWTTGSVMVVDGGYSAI